MGTNGTNDMNGYGAILDPHVLNHMLTHILQRNLKNQQESGRRGPPLCIWGKHGQGKTSIVRQICEEQNWKFSIFSPASVEEMGDINGMPSITEEEGVLRTVYAAPTWVPVREGPGILLLDDVNRADERILRGLMQLMLEGSLSSWSLPKGWMIVCTGNPEGDVYSVTSMDPAMLTRLTNVTMKFDPQVWAKWAAVQQIDERIIAFGLDHSELIEKGILTTPRSLHALSDQLHPFTASDVMKHLPLIVSIASAHLDPDAVSIFVTFLTQDLAKMVSPHEIFGTMDLLNPSTLGAGRLSWDQVKEKYHAATTQGTNAGAATVTATRALVALFAFIKGSRTAPALLTERLVALLSDSATPADVAKFVHTDLITVITSELPLDQRQDALRAFRDAGLARKISGIYRS